MAQYMTIEEARGIVRGGTGGGGGTTSLQEEGPTLADLIAQLEQARRLTGGQGAAPAPVQQEEDPYDAAIKAWIESEAGGGASRPGYQFDPPGERAPGYIFDPLTGKVELYGSPYGSAGGDGQVDTALDWAKFGLDKQQIAELINQNRIGNAMDYTRLGYDLKEGDRRFGLDQLTGDRNELGGRANVGLSTADLLRGLINDETQRYADPGNYPALAAGYAGRESASDASLTSLLGEGFRIKAPEIAGRNQQLDALLGQLTNYAAPMNTNVSAVRGAYEAAPGAADTFFKQDPVMLAKMFGPKPMARGGMILAGAGPDQKMLEGLPTIESIKAAQMPSHAIAPMSGLPTIESIKAEQMQRAAGGSPSYVTPTVRSATAPGAGTYQPPPPGSYGPPAGPGYYPTGNQPVAAPGGGYGSPMAGGSGGMTTGPVSINDIRTGTPLAVAGENGPEPIAVGADQIRLGREYDPMQATAETLRKILAPLGYAPRSVMERLNAGQLPGPNMLTDPFLARLKPSTRALVTALIRSGLGSAGLEDFEFERESYMPGAGTAGVGSILR